MTRSPSTATQIPEIDVGESIKKSKEVLEADESLLKSSEQSIKTSTQKNLQSVGKTIK
jgi:hypothetical protein